MSAKDYLAIQIEGALNRYPLISLKRGEYDTIASTAAQACVDAGFASTLGAEKVAELEQRLAEAQRALAAPAPDAALAAGWLPAAAAQRICDEAAGRAISEAVRDGWREDIVRGIFLARDAIRAALDVAPSDESRAM